MNRLSALVLPLLFLLSPSSDAAERNAATPTQVFGRDVLDRSGAATLADFLRGLPLQALGVSTPGLTNTALAQANPLGLGSARAQMLLDGRPMPVSAVSGSGANLVVIPLSLIERIEWYAAGESAAQGSGATLPTLNIVLRAADNQLSLSLGLANPRQADSDQAALRYGVRGDRGGFAVGIAREHREELAAADLPWIAPSASTFANNFLRAMATSSGSFTPTGFLTHPTQGAAVPGGCSGEHYRLTGSTSGTRCVYDVNALRDVEPTLSTDAVSFTADWQLPADSTLRLDAWTSLARTSAVLAPPPLLPEALLTPSSPNHPAQRAPTLGYDPAQPLFLRHRLAGIDARQRIEDRQDAFAASLDGHASTMDWRLTLAHNASSFEASTTGVLDAALAAQAIADGRYNIYAPSTNGSSVLNQISRSERRDGSYRANLLETQIGAPFGQFAGGPGYWQIHAQYQRQSLDSAADGTAARSAVAIARDTAALGLDAIVPLLPRLSTTFGVRQDSVEGLSGEPAAQLGLRYDPAAGFWLQADLSAGYVAPDLWIQGASVSGPQRSTVFVFGLAPECSPPFTAVAEPCALAINDYRVANPALNAERHQQSRLALGWTQSESLTAELAWYAHRISDRIEFIDATSVVRCLLGPGSDCPADLASLPVNQVGANPAAGLGWARQPAADTPNLVQSGYANTGNLSINGLELIAQAQYALSDGDDLRAHLNANFLNRYRLDDADLLGRHGVPRWRAWVDLAWTHGPYTLSWQLRHTGANDAYGPGAGDAQTPRLASYTVHDLQLRWRTGWQAEIALGIRNLSDRGPPLDSQDPSAAGYNPALYEAVGRTPYLQYRQSW